MSDETLIRHCSPTLAGLKTASLFSCSYNSAQELNDRIRDLNRRFSSKGLRILPLKKNGRKALIYVYRPEKLKIDFADNHTKKLLSDMGYINSHPERSIAILADRIRKNDRFPHEIGLFLGYPPCDVQGFINNGAKECKCSGFWKVYSNEEDTQKLFAKFRKCTKVYTARLAQGASLERLTVKC